MPIHTFFGKKSFDSTFEKLLKRIINPYLEKVTGINYDYDFKVKSRYGDRDSDYQDWIIEVYTDKPVPLSFPYSEEQQKKRNVYGFYHNVLEAEMRDLIKNMGIEIGQFRNTVGVRLMNVKDKIYK